MINPNKQNQKHNRLCWPIKKNVNPGYSVSNSNSHNFYLNQNSQSYNDNECFGSKLFYCYIHVLISKQGFHLWNSFGMSERYCHNCECVRETERDIGIGSIFLVFVTAGLWLFLLPFYPKRCTVCDSSQTSAIKSSINKKHERLIKKLLLYFILLMVFIIIFQLFRLD